MSVIHCTIKPHQPKSNPPRIQPGDVVIVWQHPELVSSDSDAWWMGEVVGVKNDSWKNESTSNLLYQIADIDSGLIHWCQMNCIQKVTLPMASPFSKVVPIDDYI